MSDQTSNQAIIVPHDTINQVTADVNMQAATRQERKDFLSRIFQSRVEREIELAQASTVKDHFEFQRGAIQLAHDAQLQAIKEMYEDYLIQGTAENRKKRIDFFEEQLSDLQVKSIEKSRYFLTGMSAEYDKLETIKPDYMREQQEDAIQMHVNKYMGTNKNLISGFVDIVNQELSIR